MTSSPYRYHSTCKDLEANETSVALTTSLPPHRHQRNVPGPTRSTISGLMPNTRTHLGEEIKNRRLRSRSGVAHASDVDVSDRGSVRAQVIG